MRARRSSTVIGWASERRLLSFAMAESAGAALATADAVPAAIRKLRRVGILYSVVSCHSVPQEYLKADTGQETCATGRRQVRRPVLLNLRFFARRDELWG